MLKDIKRRLERLEAKGRPAASFGPAPWAKEHVKVLSDFLFDLVGGKKMTNALIKEQATTLSRSYGSREAFGRACAQMSPEEESRIRSLIDKEIKKR